MFDIDKIKVIDKLEVTDFESNFGLYEKALVSDIFAFYFNKYNLHFAIFMTSISKKYFIWRYMFILFEEIAKCMSFLFELIAISLTLKLFCAYQNQIRNQQLWLRSNTLILGRQACGEVFYCRKLHLRQQHSTNWSTVLFLF